MKAAGVLRQFVAPQSQTDQTLAQSGVFGIHHPLSTSSNRRAMAASVSLWPCRKVGEPLAVLVLALRSGAHVGMHHFLEAVRLQDALSNLPERPFRPAVSSLGGFRTPAERT